MTTINIVFWPTKRTGFFKTNNGKRGFVDFVLRCNTEEEMNSMRESLIHLGAKHQGNNPVHAVTFEINDEIEAFLLLKFDNPVDY